MLILIIFNIISCRRIYRNRDSYKSQIDLKDSQIDYLECEEWFLISNLLCKLYVNKLTAVNSVE